MSSRNLNSAACSIKDKVDDAASLACDIISDIETSYRLIVFQFCISCRSWQLSPSYAPSSFFLSYIQHVNNKIQEEPMYSPKIREAFIPLLYRLAKQLRKPMTAVVNEIIAKELEQLKSRGQRSVTREDA